METRKIKIEDVVLNEGQIPGVPANPRQWTKDELKKLKKSLKETPELFEARGILVYLSGGKYVALGGNMRLTASREMRLEEVPCIIIPEGTPAGKLKEMAAKDNGTFGSWDFDMLANEWGDLPLTGWGVPAWNTEGESEERQTATEDDFDEEKDHIAVICKPGDIWQLGEHRLMCGDSTDLETVKKLMGGGTC